MAQVIGVGGVFFQCEYPEALMGWYRDVLGVQINDYGGMDFLHAASAERFPQGARTIFSGFKAGSDYFQPSEHAFMVNLMVDDMEGMLERIKKAGVELAGEPQSFDYGHFAWVMDPNGVKIELWQPIEPA